MFTKNGQRLIILLVCLLALISPAFGADPSGAATFEENPDTAINFAWVLICGFLVMSMQAGFALLEAGLTRAKNAANIMMKNMMDFCIGALGYWAIGFALMMGTATGITGLMIGLNGFFLWGDAYDVATIEMWFWQMVFCATAATIVSGAMAERTKFSTYFIASLIVTAFIYPIYGHWMWGGGWLSQLGALDFAGSGVVHCVGGFIALAGAWLVGPRVGKYRKDGTPVGIPGHSITLAILGVFILWFGWFGFNPGSTVAAQANIALIAVTTNLAACTAGLAAMVTAWVRYGKPDVSMSFNGVLAGLVAITAGCANVSPDGAMIIGLIAGVVVVLSVDFIDKVLKIDDPVGAISVHGVCGALGTLCVGLFASPEYGGVAGLFYGGGMTQLITQAIGVGSVFLWAFGTGLVLFFALKVTVGIRVPAEEEIKGLDITEHGQEAYSGFQIFTNE